MNRKGNCDNANVFGWPMKVSKIEFGKTVESWK